jgi:hypothetical protein
MIAVDMARDVPVGGILGKQKEKGALQSSSSSFSFRVPLSFSLEI